MLNRIKKLLNKKDNTNINPFTQLPITDRRIEKFKYCKICNSHFGDNFELAHVIKYGERKDTYKVICDRCGEIYYFINFEYEEGEANV